MSAGLSLRAADIHARLGAAWPSVLAKLGIGDTFLRLKKSGPCPACGGEDRYTFDNRRGRGDFLCRKCGPGDGFALLERVNGWNFSEARRQVMAVAGLIDAHGTITAPKPRKAGPASEPPVGRPTARVLSIAHSVCQVADCADAVAYLTSRGLWPLPEAHQVHAHPAVDYWEDGRRIARYPAIVAEVRDANGELATIHVTYLANGQKIQGSTPRKLLSKVEGREGCAVRLLPPTEVLGIAEGIETALSAAAIDGVPVWAALNTSLLSRFEPPHGVDCLRIYADRDEAGLIAAGRLMERLQGRMPFELRLPTAPHKDFNDEWMSRIRGKGTEDA